MFTIKHYVSETETDIFETWLCGLRDKQARARIITRLERVALGNFGDCKMLQNSVWELRIDYGPGYRVYYGIAGKEIVLLLCGGDKRAQNADIKKAIFYFEDYKRRNI